MERDKRDPKKINDEISATINPFHKSIHRDNVLLNFCTGKQASKSTDNFHLSLTYEGRNKRDDFVQECLEDTKQFEKPIKMTKIVNFATEDFLN